MYTIYLNNEDDTIGNLVSKELLKNKKITFASYNKQHPFDKNITIEFESKDDPNKILQNTIENIQKQIDNILKSIII